MKRACVIGCSDGIGLATVRTLLEQGWAATGVSRSVSAIVHERYAHFRMDVATEEYRELLRGWSREPFDAVSYCVGITPEAAASVITRTLRGGSRRVSVPFAMVLLVAALRWAQGLKQLLR